ncbi:hypothetical protein G6F64_015231 [Rhizopus arrhizus]|uniref:Uncharacterized protein n=1 Tax=Rhizopus oryzae TaxID=64495 RepID=A0A9P6WRY2_RHIOR|nr:hypothetical protein G6F64_015231 [Rhizopus arrhizus]
MMTVSVPSGSFCAQCFLRCTSMGSTALSSPARRCAQRVLEPCGSASAITVALPCNAAYAARWVATVVLPTPPLEPATRIVFMPASLPGTCPERTPAMVTGGSAALNLRRLPLLSWRPRRIEPA